MKLMTIWRDDSNFTPTVHDSCMVESGQDEGRLSGRWPWVFCIQVAKLGHSCWRSQRAGLAETHQVRLCKGRPAPSPHHPSRHSAYPGWEVEEFLLLALLKDWGREEASSGQEGMGLPGDLCVLWSSRLSVPIWTVISRLCDVCGIHLCMCEFNSLWI